MSTSSKTKKFSIVPDLRRLILAVLGFELRASSLLGRCSTTALFWFSYFLDRVGLGL
jgi:hypothetical protein